MDGRSSPGRVAVRTVTGDPIVRPPLGYVWGVPRETAPHPLPLLRTRRPIAAHSLAAQFREQSAEMDPIGVALRHFEVYLAGQRVDFGEFVAVVAGPRRREQLA